MRRFPIALLIAALLLSPAVTTAGPAAASDCPPSGGATIPRATAEGDVVFSGGGWGHGLGMSQYGAQGAAKLGCTYTQILTRYYAGTEVVTRPMPDSIRLRMLDDGYRIDVEAVGGPQTWVLPGCVGPTAQDPAAAPCPPVQPQGARWQLRVDPDSGQYVLWDVIAIPKVEVWRGGGPTQQLQLRQDGTAARITTWKAASIYLDRWLRWDWTRISQDAGRLDAVQQIGDSAVGTAMDKYLWGIAEVPASFPVEALKAQAVAARTYAAKRADRVLLPTPQDQNYTGWKKETEGTDGAWGARWKAAVDATSGQVIALAGGGGLIDAFYSSSMGGHTEDERYVWGVEAPWLRAVDDSAWELASTNPPENRSWAKGFSWAALANKLGFSAISDISVPPRGDPARVGGVTVTGIQGGALVTRQLEGWDVREALGLLSPGFTVSYARAGGAAAQPLTGDWDGDGADQPGWYRDGLVALSMRSGDRAWTKRFRFGRAGDVAVVGDWNRDGTDDVGVFRDGAWLLRVGHRGGKPTTTFVFGRAGDRPVVGSWNGRTLGVGVVRGNQWLLRRTLSSGAPHRSFRFGRPTDLPVVGPWSGTGRYGIGVVRDGRWLLRYGRSAGKPRVRLDFGRAGDRPVVGDWDGDGRASIGIARKVTFRLRPDLLPGTRAAARTFTG